MSKSELKWVVEAHMGISTFEPIAAFNCEGAAIDYAARCASHQKLQMGLRYRVVYRKKVLWEKSAQEGV